MTIINIMAFIVHKKLISIIIDGGINTLTGHMINTLFFIDNIYVRFGITQYRDIVSIPMEPNCAPPKADLLLYCYKSKILPNCCVNFIIFISIMFWR